MSQVEPFKAKLSDPFSDRVHKLRRGTLLLGMACSAFLFSNPQLDKFSLAGIEFQHAKWALPFGILICLTYTFAELVWSAYNEISEWRLHNFHVRGLQSIHELTKLHDSFAHIIQHSDAYGVTGGVSASDLQSLNQNVLKLNNIFRKSSTTYAVVNVFAVPSVLVIFSYISVILWARTQ